MNAPREKMPLLFRENPQVTNVTKIEHTGTVVANENLRQSMTLDAIQNLLHETIQAEIDIELLFQLGFDTMDWQMVDVRRSLYGLFLGKNRADSKPILLPETEGIIAVSTDVHKERVVFTALDVSGVIADSSGTNRTLGLRYNLPSQNLKEMTISLSDEEQEAYGFPDYDTNWAFPGLDTRDRYFNRVNAGTPHPMTSPAMIERTEGHSNAVRVRADIQHLLLGQEQVRGEIKDISGFFERRNDKTITVGLREDHPDRWDEFQTIWEASVPRHLVYTPPLPKS